MQVQDVKGIPTHVFSLRHRPSAASKKKPPSLNRSLLLVIPGSPGMGHFYIPFASKLFKLGGGSYDVAVVSHAGHSPGFSRPPDQSKNLEDTDASPSDSSSKDTKRSSMSHRDWYNLEDQISHKLAYIEEHASDVDTLYLVGHSIGCWMALQLMKHLESTKVKKALLLFPTIESMGATPNGVRMAPLFTSWRLPFTFGVWCLSWAPDFFKRYVLRHYFHSTPSDHVDHMIQGAINIDSKAIHNILCMANQEMREVADPPLDVVDPHIDKIIFYYGVGDKWTLDCSYQDMFERYPEKEVHLCQRDCDHAFVEKSSDEMADFVHSKISTDMVG